MTEGLTLHKCKTHGKPKRAAPRLACPVHSTQPNEKCTSGFPSARLQSNKKKMRHVFFFNKQLYTTEDQSDLKKMFYLKCASELCPTQDCRSLERSFPEWAPAQSRQVDPRSHRRHHCPHCCKKKKTWTIQFKRWGKLSHTLFTFQTYAMTLQNPEFSVVWMSQHF